MRRHQKHHPSRRCPHTYLTIGQDYDSIQNYIRNVVVGRNGINTTTAYEYNDGNEMEDGGDDAISVVATETTSTATTSVDTPSIYMFYTDIQELRGLYKPIDYGGGIQYADGLLRNWHVPTPFPIHWVSPPPPPPVTTTLQIGLWLNGTIGCQNILNGRLQEQIQELFHYCIVATANKNKTTRRVSKIYLRLGYEFDNPQFGYSDAPNIYQQSFRYIIHECYTLYSYEKCRSRIDFVWHSWAASLLPVDESIPSTIVVSLDDYYPGDDYVDWVGISLFSQLYTDATTPAHITPLGNMRTVQYVCTFAQDHNKPIMIAESTPFGGIDQLHDPWQDWFVPILHLIDEYNIRMWSYIYCIWNHIPMWNNTGFGDSRLEQNHTILQLWYEHVLNNPQFRDNDDVNDKWCTHQDRSNSITMKQPRGPVVASGLWNSNSAVEASLSGSFENRMESTSQSMVYLYSSWIVLVDVVLFMIVTLTQWRIRRGRSTIKSGYEILE
jgi:hypothetical protein